jgi:S1-C subfamily serine protease
MSTRLARLLVAALLSIALALLAACGSAADEIPGTVSAPPPSSSTAATPEPAALPPDLSAAADAARRSVVRVQVRGCARGQMAEASGMVIGRRLVVTAAHVLKEGASVIVVQGGSGSEALPVSIDEANGLALVRTQANLLGQIMKFSTDPPPAAGAVRAALPAR